ncbi:hypothetical protein A9P44_03560 [Paenibacillus polymyxa]|nr:hypothetical protein A9P44_03560 [Paenibacillus polymyxa]
MKYFNLQEASEFLGVTTNRVRYLYSRRTFADTLLSGRKIMISKNDLLNYKKQLKLLGDLYSIKEVSEILGFSNSNLYRYYVKKGLGFF